MPVTFTSISRVSDWQKLQEVYQESLLNRVREIGARSLCILRDLHDASQALVIAELPDQDAACELRLALEEQVGLALVEGQVDTRAWEATGWEAIRDRRAPSSHPTAEKGGASLATSNHGDKCSPER